MSRGLSPAPKGVHIGALQLVCKRWRGVVPECALTFKFTPYWCCERHPLRILGSLEVESQLRIQHQAERESTFRAFADVFLHHKHSWRQFTTMEVNYGTTEHHDITNNFRSHSLKRPMFMHFGLLTMTWSIVSVQTTMTQPNGFFPYARIDIDPFKTPCDTV